MKNSIRYTAVTVLFALAISPALVAAQNASTTAATDAPGTTPTQWQMMGEWRQSSAMQQAIAALGSVPVEALPMPVLFGVAPADLTPNFGDPRTNHPHEGEDIMAVKGTPIVSPTAAVVLRTETGATEGNAVYTANPGGETLVYYHLDRWAEGIVAGEILQPGSLIGYVGNTGDAAGGPAHLHLEVHNSAGVPTDPFPRLTAEFTPAQKIAFLTTILGQTSDPTALSIFLVTNFRSTFTDDAQSGITLPPLITEALATVPDVSPPLSAGNSLPAGDLEVGSSGALVVSLQQFLIAKATGPAAVRLAGAGATGNFGPITEAALIEYQNAAGISPANGYYGPVTRAAVQAASAGIAVTTEPGHTTPLPGGSTSGTSGTATFTRDLYYGESGQDVLALQELLNAYGFTVAASGPGSIGQETTYFGPATQAAAIRFQVAHSISPAVGYVGPITRAGLASL